ncbi:hypothetical protein GLOTRDRAFT_141394 [Gloeophyllum trabeum ATCC 11539]|uniref:Uncharacterized protein n=1 Tax=Gloeophyllum trabeum (strain ATCC 11539 / FP-39264 / Madison 617) TaxID=670483 RepID=S7R8D1_GLOTA|nr:uncharacterized protein GLOTRDRAFT_141394 [Gloeophyllum trabeum ATCC 11539]EPQ50580.1 hypothetical protein GLOTRDRAFT_141394 [Gloeophyllum trabeum ATCC 11539]
MPFRKTRKKLAKRIKRLFGKIVPPPKDAAPPPDFDIVPAWKETAANRVPVEILMKIIEEATDVPGALDAVVFMPKFSKENELYYLKLAKRTALSMVQVSRVWKTMATIYLYRIIRLNNEEQVPLLARTLADPITWHYGSYVRRLELTMGCFGFASESLPRVIRSMPLLQIFRWRHPEHLRPLVDRRSFRRPEFVDSVLRELPPTLRALDTIRALPMFDYTGVRVLLRNLPCLQTLNVESAGEFVSGVDTDLRSLCSIDLSRTKPLVILNEDELPSLVQLEDIVYPHPVAPDPLDPFDWTPNERPERLIILLGDHFRKIRSIILRVDENARMMDVGHYVDIITRKTPNLVNLTLILHKWSQFPPNFLLRNAVYLGFGLVDPRAIKHAPEGEDDGRYWRFFHSLSWVRFLGEFQAIYFLDDALYYHANWIYHNTWDDVASEIRRFRYEILFRDGTTLVPESLENVHPTPPSVRVRNTMDTVPLRDKPPFQFSPEFQIEG